MGRLAAMLGEMTAELTPLSRQVARHLRRNWVLHLVTLLSIALQLATIAIPALHQLLDLEAVSPGLVALVFASVALIWLLAGGIPRWATGARGQTARPRKGSNDHADVR